MKYTKLKLRTFILNLCLVAAFTPTIQCSSQADEPLVLSESVLNFDLKPLLSTGDSVSALDKDCSERGALYLDEKKSIPMTALCIDHTINSALPGNIRRTSDNQNIVYAFNNMIITKRTASFDVRQPASKNYWIISGKHSNLQSIHSIALNPSESEIIALNGNSISTYEMGVSGNISPKRTLASPDLVGATALHLSLGHNQDFILVVNPKKSAIQFFDRKASVFQQNGKERVKQKGSITFPFKGPSSIAVDSDAGEIFVTDQDSILVFNISARGAATPLRIIKGPTTQICAPTGNTPNAISYSNKNDLIEIINCDGTALRFLRTVTGDATPWVDASPSPSVSPSPPATPSPSPSVSPALVTSGS